MIKDRRIFQRLDGIINVRYAVKGRDREKIETLPRNIGGGGVGICLTEKLQNGTILELEITVPDNPQKAISGAGQVQWTKPFGVIRFDKSVSLHETGIKFIDIDPLAIGRVYTYSRQLKNN
ncbi:MAG: PilZ domain-containing protein [Candidatus Omnitrophica bacterium]|nr:PilZ domain-containing protein [Candidatus Omnitrophota bacterium]